MKKQKSKQHQLLSNLIHARMKLTAMTMADVAAYLGISYIYMSSLSNGARKISGLNIDKQRALAKFLGLSMVEFFLMTGALRQEDLINH